MAGEQELGDQAEVERVALPAGHRGVRVDGRTMTSMVLAHCGWSAAEGLRVIGDAPAVGASKDEPPAGSALEPVAALVHEPVVVAAQQHEVLDARRPSVRPVGDVVPVDEAMESAARKAAPSVARRERATNRRRNAAGPAPYAQRPAAALTHRDDTRIARQPPRRLGRERVAVVQLAPTGPIVCQRLSVDVDYDLVTFTTRARSDS